MPKKEVKISGQQLVQMYEMETAKAQAMERDIRQVAAGAVEIEGAINALEELKGKKNQKIMARLGAGAMIEAISSDTNRVKLLQAGNIAVEKSNAEAAAQLKKDLEETKKQLEQMQKNYSQVMQNRENFRKVLETMQRQAQKKQ